MTPAVHIPLQVVHLRLQDAAVAVDLYPGLGLGLYRGLHLVVIIQVRENEKGNLIGIILPELNVDNVAAVIDASIVLLMWYLHPRNVTLITRVTILEAVYLFLPKWPTTIQNISRTYAMIESQYKVIQRVIPFNRRPKAKGRLEQFLRFLSQSPTRKDLLQVSMTFH